MASVLEKLGFSTRGLEETIQPFLSWNDSPVKDWNVTLRMLTTGELVNLAEHTAKVSSAVEAAYLSKIHLLAVALVSIDGQSIVTDEDVEKYNKEHNLSGSHKINLYNLKVLFLKKLTEPVVNALVIAYDQMQDRYLERHIGKTSSQDSNETPSKVMDENINEISPKNNTGSRKASNR